MVLRASCCALPLLSLGPVAACKTGATAVFGLGANTHQSFPRRCPSVEVLLQRSGVLDIRRSPGLNSLWPERVIHKPQSASRVVENFDRAAGFPRGNHRDWTGSRARIHQSGGSRTLSPMWGRLVALDISMVIGGVLPDEGIKRLRREGCVERADRTGGLRQDRIASRHIA